jgi:hypothetical protein
MVMGACVETKREEDGGEGEMAVTRTFVMGSWLWGKIGVITFNKILLE